MTDLDGVQGRAIEDHARAAAVCALPGERDVAAVHVRELVEVPDVSRRNDARRGRVEEIVVADHTRAGHLVGVRGEVPTNVWIDLFAGRGVDANRRSSNRA